MTESQLYEALGRKQAVIEAQDAAYGQLLQVVALVLKGEVELSRLMVNLTERSWVMAPPCMAPDLPGTINGKPECVVWRPKPPQVPCRKVGEEELAALNGERGEA